MKTKNRTLHISINLNDSENSIKYEELFQALAQLVAKDAKAISSQRSSVLLRHFISNEIQKEHCTLSTKQNKHTTLQWIATWYPDLQLDEVTPDFISEFILKMKEQKFKDSTISKHLHHLRHYLYIAVRKGLVSPSLRDAELYTYKVENYHHSYLLPEELRAMEEYAQKELPETWKVACHAFLFSCYTGLRFSDIIKITPQHVKLRGKTHWLILKTQKTGTEIRLPLEYLFMGKALYIYNKVKDNGGPYLFPLGTNTATNKILQRLTKRAGVLTHVSFHSARHTFATNLLYKGAHLEVIQKLLGHQSIKTTQIYAEMTDASLVNSLKILDKNLSKTKKG